MARVGLNINKRKDNRYEGRILIGRKECNKPNYRYFYGKTKEEVISKMNTFEKRNDPSEEDTNYMVSSWLTYWLESNIKIAVKKSTYYNYRGIINRHILPVLGDIQLSKLTHEDIQGFIGGLIDKGLQSSTLHAVFRILNSALEKAVELEKLIKNPCKGITLPKKSRHRPKSLTKNQQEILLNMACQDKYGAAVIIAMFTGMRIGEISVLRWENINLEERIIYVKETILRVQSIKHNEKKTMIIRNDPKSDYSNRIIPIPLGLLSYLIDLKQKAKGEYVVYCKDGKFAEPRVIQYRFKKLLEKAGLESINFHALRHTFATRSIESKADIVSVSRLLGHASVKMTLDYYADSTLEQRRKVMDYQDTIFQQMMT